MAHFQLLMHLTDQNGLINIEFMIYANEEVILMLVNLLSNLVIKELKMVGVYIK
jgi:hypothetical protein